MALGNAKGDCYSDARMKSFSRVTNSFVMTAALLAVIIGSLCFSVGEGLRLTPFPITALSQTEDAGTVVNAKDSSVSLSKYGPLDVPAQSQKRGKRNGIEFAAGSLARRELVITFAVTTLQCEANNVSLLPHIAPSSGRAPPLHS